jgi:hypothetical protein
VQLKQDVTVDVANAVTAANLKTAKLFKDQATPPEIHGMPARARRPTLEKEGLDDKFKYEDRFLAAAMFQWQSQNRTTQNRSQWRSDTRSLGAGIGGSSCLFGVTNE